MTARRPWALLLAALTLAAACGDDDDPTTTFDAPLAVDGGMRDAPVLDAPGAADAALPDAARPDAATGPITAPANTWTWIDVPGALCDDGSETGIGVNLNPDSDNLLIFFNGGGACWSYETCVLANTSTHGPIGATQFNNIRNGLGGVFSRADSNNPFRDWNFVWIPYCTGDIHGGNKVNVYTASGGGNARTIHHVGHANVLAYLVRLAATFPSPPRLVVSGSSAGGFGALLNYTAVREALDPEKSYLINDSGPLLVGNAIVMPLRDAFYASWNLGVVADPLCGQACRTDFSEGITALAEKYPSDRLALLSSLQDITIRTYFALSADAFQAALLALATDVIDETSNFEYFLIPGSTHTMLGNPGNFMSGTTKLWDWMTAQVTDATWSSVKP